MPDEPHLGWREGYSSLNISFPGPLLPCWTTYCEPINLENTCGLAKFFSDLPCFRMLLSCDQNLLPTCMRLLSWYYACLLRPGLVRQAALAAPYSRDVVGTKLLRNSKKTKIQQIAVENWWRALPFWSLKSRSASEKERCFQYSIFLPVFQPTFTHLFTQGHSFGPSKKQSGEKY